MPRFLHTADWQIGKRFGQVPGDPGALLREQRIATIERIGVLAIERQVDAVLVAGDVFDLVTVEERTLRRVLDVLARFEVPWLLLPGNHDPAVGEGPWTRLERIGLPSHVRPLLGDTPTLLANGRLAVLPAPLRQRHEARDRTEWFDDAVTPPGAVRVGLAHGSVKNRLPAISEAQNPIADDRADRARLDYLALGDWHGMLKIAPRTYYAGTPEPDRFRDNEPGLVLDVRIDAPGEAPIVQPIEVGHYRWRTIEASIDGAHDLTALRATLTDLAEEPGDLVLQVRLRGRPTLETRDQLDVLLADWGARVLHLAVDDDRVEAAPSEADLDRLGREGLVGEAVRRLRAIAADEEHADHEAAGDALPLLYRLAAEELDR
jgi:DNA repair exonuclease SbcCD nuclease subunit